MRAYWAEGSQIHVHTNGDLAMQVRHVFKGTLPKFLEVFGGMTMAVFLKQQFFIAYCNYPSIAVLYHS